MEVPEMQYTSLGDTGLRVSVAGLGCGGFSRLGLARGGTVEEAADVVRSALDLGVNFLDTAAAYGTETAVGRAVSGRDRDAVVVSTKAQVTRGDGLRPAGEVIASLEESLARLGLDHVDVFHLHAVPPSAYARVVEEIVPALERERDRGKLRFLGITERGPADPGHEMLERAIPAGPFRVVMVAFHMLHQGARHRVFPLAIQHRVGTLVMFAVRLLFSVEGRLGETLRALAREGRLDAAEDEAPGLLDFVRHPRGARDLIEAAYRFCRHQPGADVVLFGTGNRGRVPESVASILGPPLPAADVERLHRLFGHLEGVGLDAPKG